MKTLVNLFAGKERKSEIFFGKEEPQALGGAWGEFLILFRGGR